jgi:hypothetical protein
MKLINLVVLLLCLYSCSSKYQLYFTDNIELDKAIEDIEGCEGISELIRNNFFFNKTDSLYVENYTLAFLLMHRYSDCLKNMNQAQMIRLFGRPTSISEDGMLSYSVNSFGMTNKSTYDVIFGGSPLNYFRSHRNQMELNDMNYDQIVKNSKLKGADFIKRKSLYKQVDNIDLPDHCFQRKKGLDQQVFFHHERKHWIVNSLVLEYLKLDIDAPNPCISSFTLSEIEGLFGVVNVLNKDTISFNLYHENLSGLIGEKKKYNGKMPVLQFRKLPGEFYNVSFEIINLE